MITNLESLTKASDLKKATDERRVRIINRQLRRVLDDCAKASQIGKYAIAFHSEMPEYQPCDEEMVEALFKLGFKRLDGIYITWRD